MLLLVGPIAVHVLALLPRALSLKLMELSLVVKLNVCV